MNSNDVIEQAASGFPFDQGDSVDMDIFGQKLKKKVQGIFNVAYQVVIPEEKNNGQSFISSPVEVYIFEQGETNQPFSIQNPKVRSATAKALIIVRRIRKVGTFTGVRIEPVLVETSSQMVGAKITGMLQLRDLAPIC